MPMLTRGMIIQQQMARNAGRATTPSTPSLHSTSHMSSLSDSPSLASSSYSYSPIRSPQGQSTPTKCWIPTLDEVSRADPDERDRLFARLALEAERDAQHTTPRTPERRFEARNSGCSSVSSLNDSSAENGAMALRPPCLSEDGLVPNAGLQISEWSDLDDSGRMEIDDQELFSQWIVDIPGSPLTSSSSIGREAVSEEVIAGWSKEDAEMEMIAAQNNRLRMMGQSLH